MITAAPNPTRPVIAAVLSLSMLTLMANAAIGPALAEIAAAFPQYGRTMIKLVITLPAVFIIPTTFLSASLVKSWGAKRILLAGLGCYLIGGVAGGLMSSFHALLACRALLGIGVGLIMPVSTSLPTALFAGEQRMAMMGRIVAANYLGGIVVMLGSGWLATLSWQWSFIVYLVAIPSILLVVLFLPETEKGRVPESSGHLDWRVILMATGMFWIMVALYCVPTNVALHLQHLNLGDSRTAGILSSIMMAMAMAAGLSILKVRRLFGRWTGPAVLFILCAGFGTVATAQSVAQMSIGQAAAGFGLGSLIPVIMLRVQTMAPRDKTVLAMAVASSMLYLGQFMSPVVLDGTAHLLFGNERPDLAFAVVAIGAAGLSAILALRAVRRRGEPVAPADPGGLPPA